MGGRHTPVTYWSSVGLQGWPFSDGHAMGLSVGNTSSPSRWELGAARQNSNLQPTTVVFIRW